LAGHLGKRVWFFPQIVYWGLSICSRRYVATNSSLFLVSDVNCRGIVGEDGRKAVIWTAVGVFIGEPQWIGGGNDSGPRVMPSPFLRYRRTCQFMGTLLLIHTVRPKLHTVRYPRPRPGDQNPFTQYTLRDNFMFIVGTRAFLGRCSQKR
jgi:hypothetical protein